MDVKATELGGESHAAAAQSPFTWLNLVCVDAPLVAVSWYWLIATTYGVAIRPANAAALFLTAWLIYLADRLGDSVATPLGVPKSLRQRFCTRHRRAWLVALGVVALADAVVIPQALPRATIAGGLVVGLMALGYLLTNQLSAKIWRVAPLKEISIGSLFAAGTAVALLPDMLAKSPALIPLVLLFACVCSLNCISIAVWEQELDREQGRESIATRFSNVAHYLRPIGLTIAAFALLLGYCEADVRIATSAIAVSALCIVALDVMREAIKRDTRTALADLVLLAPPLAGVWLHSR